MGADVPAIVSAHVLLVAGDGIGSLGVAGFRRVVLETLAREVQWGETVTYGELADLAGRPRAARAAGSAMRDNPLPFVIPCHRVVAAGGRIGGYGGGRNAVALKRRLLEREGVTGLRG